MKFNFLLVAFMLLMAFLPLGFAWDVAPETNLIAYWALNETSGVSIDAVTGAYNGTNYSVTQNVAGIIDRGHTYVAASSSRTDLGASADLYFNSDMTISGWIKKTGSTAAHIISKRIDSGGSFNYALGMAGGKAFFTSYRTAGVMDVYSSNDINDGAWHMVTGVSTGAGLYVYVDGNLKGFQANTQPARALTATYSAMMGTDNISSYFSLTSDEVGLWSRALSAADVNEMYYLGIGQTYDTATGTFIHSAPAPAALTVSVKDEKTWADLNAVITINSVSYTMTNSNFDINLATIPAGPLNVVISKSGYVTRNYQFDNNGVSADLNMLLETNPITVAFKFKVPGLNLYATNTYVKIDLNANGTNVWTIGSYLTDSTGSATIAIDSNNQRYYTYFDFNGVSYAIPPVALTVAMPRDEITDTNILNSNFNLLFTNNYYYYYGDRNTQLHTYIIPNMVDYVFINVDSNNVLYASRDYFLRYDSDDTNDTFIPYLPLIAGTGGYVNFLTKSKTRNTVQYVDFEIFKTINGIKTLVMSGRTDVTGSRLFAFLLGENYAIDVYKDGIQYESAYLYTATATPVYWYLNTSTNDINIQQYYVETDISFNPTGPKLLGTDTIIHVTMNADNIVQYTYRIYQYNDINMMTGIKIQSTGGGACAGNNCIASVAIPLMDVNKSFYLDFNMVYNNWDTNKNVVKVFTKTVTSNLDPFRLAFNVRTDFGCNLDPNSPCALSMIVSTVLTLIALFAIMKLAGVFFGLGSLVIAILLLGLFTFVGWFYWPLYIFIVVGAILVGASGFARGGGNV